MLVALQEGHRRQEARVSTLEAEAAGLREANGRLEAGFEAERARAAALWAALSQGSGCRRQGSNPPHRVLTGVFFVVLCCHRFMRHHLFLIARLLPARDKLCDLRNIAQ